MATKSEQTRAQMQRDARDAKPRKPATMRAVDPTQPPRRSKGQVPAAEALADSSDGAEGQATKPAKAHGTRAESHAVVKIEAASPEGKVSRKSTRASANRVKSDSQLTNRTKRAVNSPKARAAKAVAASATHAGGRQS
jgi:hypothetical protein